MTCPRLVSKDLVSVYVGHIHHEVTKAELVELFSGCGRVEDLFIVENQRAGSYNFGFVRFKKMESAVKAVTDLHRWKLHGTTLVVDLAKDTFEKFEKGNINREDLYGKKEGDKASSRVTQSPVGTMSGVNPGVKDVMYMSRVRETCISLDLDARLKMQTLPGYGSRLNHVDVDCLMEDISKAKQDRVSTQCEPLPEEASIKNVKEKLLLGTGDDLALGREKVKDFVSALSDVMGTINTFLKEHQLEELGEENKIAECKTEITSDNLQSDDSRLQDYKHEDNILSDTSPRSEMVGSISVALKDVPDLDPLSRESSISSSDDSDTGVFGGDSGVEFDHKSCGGAAVIQGDNSPLTELKSDSTPAAKKSDTHFNPVVQNFFARASLGRGRGYGRGTPAAMGYGRGMATLPFQGYGRGNRHMIKIGGCLVLDSSFGGEIGSDIVAGFCLLKILV
ncbi:uncharacterized protein LOC132561910 [Ylistrum balloti]|uniref:uncharacterized protein LOC132561910 n=1 Tax=Ylistrum balloti TaxID=509963 RepID=UPI002905AEAC|nr:uncharacterized protein LOC132561910 [Ylistrum balloti]